MQSINRRSLLKSAFWAGSFFSISPFISDELLESRSIKEFYSNNNLIRLNSNENPYGPSPKARQAIIEHIALGNRYPRGVLNKLYKKIAEKEGVSSDHLIITAGSSELLGLAGAVYGLEKGELICSVPTFDFLLYFSQFFGGKWIKVPMESDFQYNLKGIKQKITKNTKLIFVCNPNNPTGIEIPNAELREFCREMSSYCPIYVDEAYIEMSSKGTKNSMVNLVNNYPNIVVARTFSKVYGMAGLRVGYAISHPNTIRKLKKYHMGRLVTPSVTSAAAALASLDDDEFLQKSIQLNDKAKEMVYKKFDDWGIAYLPSATNFILFKTDKFNSKYIDRELQKKEVLIRTYNHVPGWARVSMGTIEEMSIFLDHTKQLLSS